MKSLLKILNPLIFLANLFNYMAHLENQRLVQKYEPYDFSRDLKYF